MQYKIVVNSKISNTKLSLSIENTYTVHRYLYIGILRSAIQVSYKKIAGTFLLIPNATKNLLFFEEDNH